jgi:hypothetical protein
MRPARKAGLSAIIRTLSSPAHASAMASAQRSRAAIRDFANGFLNHPENTALHEAAGNGDLRPASTTTTCCASSTACSSSWSSKSAISSFPPAAEKSSGTSTASTTAFSACGSSQNIVTLPIIAATICGWRCFPPSGSLKPMGLARSWAWPRSRATSSATRPFRSLPDAPGQ